jgi:hypothetical protein
VIDKFGGAGYLLDEMKIVNWENSTKIF